MPGNAAGFPPPRPLQVLFGLRGLFGRHPEGDSAVEREGLDQEVEAFSILVRESDADAAKICFFVLPFADVVGDVAWLSGLGWGFFLGSHNVLRCFVLDRDHRGLCARSVKKPWSPGRLLAFPQSSESWGRPLRGNRLGSLNRAGNGLAREQKGRDGRSRS